MSFNWEQALAICTANLASRKSNSSGSTYVLYYSNHASRYDGKIIGTRIKGDGGLLDIFKKNHNTFQYASIVNKDKEDKVLWFFNRAVSNKWNQMSRIGVKRNKKN